jgi:hypothetical protein
MFPEYFSLFGCEELTLDVYPSTLETSSFCIQSFSTISFNIPLPRNIYRRQIAAHLEYPKSE